jgi:hypothetical protein
MFLPRRSYVPAQKIVCSCPVNRSRHRPKDARSNVSRRLSSSPISGQPCGPAPQTVRSRAAFFTGGRLHIPGILLSDPGAIDRPRLSHRPESNISSAEVRLRMRRSRKTTRPEYRIDVPGTSDEIEGDGRHYGDSCPEGRFDGRRVDLYSENAFTFGFEIQAMHACVSARRLGVDNPL